MESAVAIFGLTAIGSFVGLLGGVFILLKKNWGKAISVHSIPFAAGVMLAVAFLDILPHAIEESGVESVLSVVLVVIVLAFFFEQFFMHFHHHEEHKRTTLKSSMPLVVAGDTIHNFFDGAAIAAAYLVNPGLGVLVAGATVLHEIPHEMGDFGLMLAAGWNRTKVLLVNVFSALSSFLGAILVILFADGIGSHLSLFLAIAGGLFVYIGASDLLPEINEEEKDNPWHQALLLLAGVAIIWVLTLFIPHIEL